MNENKKPTQCQRIKQYLQDFGSITQLEALKDLGVMRLASRMNELKEQGFKFVSVMVKAQNRYGETCKYANYILLAD